MPDRAERVRVAAARLIVVALTSLVGISVGVALAVILVKLATQPGYFPKAWYNTLLTFGMFIAGLLTLRLFDISWQRAFLFFCVFHIGAYATMMTLEYRTYVLQLGQPLYFEPSLYVPHLGILIVALTVGFKASWSVSGLTIIYLIWMGALKEGPEHVGTPLLIALILPFTAVLVERLLDEAEREAKRASLAETSLDVMAHDLGSPLAVLSSSLEMLGGSSLPPEQRDTLMRAIQRNTQTLRYLLDEFREIPHLNKPAPMQKVALHNLAHDIVQFYALSICEKRGQTLHADLRPVQVTGSPLRLGRLMRELLTNAAKYTPRGGQIEISLQAKEQAILRVSDNGWGIEKEELALLFEQGWRGDMASEELTPGTGLGLYICRQIVESHHGRIEVESQRGQGSTFTVYLPLAEEETTSSSPGVYPVSPSEEA